MSIEIAVKLKIAVGLDHAVELAAGLAHAVKLKLVGKEN